MSHLFRCGHHVFTGTVTHERLFPKQHRFSYQLFYLFIDLDQVDQLATLSPFWSVNRRNIVEFRHQDYLKSHQNGSSPEELKKRLIDAILTETQETFSGKIFLLGNLRYWGYCFNPVSYYFCFNHNGELQYIIDEVTNTPWQEQHLYIHKLPAVSSQVANDTLCKINCTFEKALHVSPFMPMGLLYKTRYTISNSKILIHMDLHHLPSSKTDNNNAAGERPSVFYATMNLTGQPLTKQVANWLPFRYPFQCSKIIAAIYWQACKLWIKRVPFFTHPNP